MLGLHSAVLRQRRNVAVSSYRHIPSFFSTSPNTTQQQQQQQQEEGVDADPKHLVRDRQRQYEIDRSVYKKQVSILRKQYAREISIREAEESAKQAIERADILKKKKERQRLKNLRSIENAKRDLFEKAQRKVEFERELEVQQIKRSQRNALFQKARLLLIEEMEEESEHWMMDRNEIDAQLLGVENEQRLWATPFLIGVAPPDATFWRYESHAMPMQKTYLSPREHVLEKLEEHMVLKKSLDSNYWSLEKKTHIQKWLEKAKLRALVQNSGRNILLKRQNDLLKEVYLKDAPQLKPQQYPQRGLVRPQKKIPAPSLQLLANYSEQEKEGVDLLKKDPSRFFVFEESSMDSNHDDKINLKESPSQQQQQSLGKPISLLHEFGPKGAEEPYPLLLAKHIKPDTRSEKEKKRALKEEERLAKLQASMETQEGGLDFEHDVGDLAEIEEDDEETQWVEDMMSKAADMSREELQSVPLEQRLNEEDVDWIVSQLEHKQHHNSSEATLSYREREIKEKASVLLGELNKEQMEQLAVLDLSEYLMSEEGEDVANATMKTLIRKCVGESTWSDKEIETIIDVERKLARDETLRKKLLRS